MNHTRHYKSMIGDCLLLLTTGIVISVVVGRMYHNWHLLTNWSTDETITDMSAPAAVCFVFLTVAIWCKTSRCKPG